jgi:hypothetical protein
MENRLGKGEVESSILSCSTIPNGAAAVRKTLRSRHPRIKPNKSCAVGALPSAVGLSLLSSNLQRVVIRR